MNQEQAESRLLNNKRIAIYLILTFFITYAVEIFIIAPMVGSTDINQAMMAQSLVAGVMFVPSVSVILTRLITKEGFVGKNTYLSLAIKKNLKYYMLTWFGFAALILLGAALYYLIFPSQFDWNMGYASAAVNAQKEGDPFTVEEIKYFMRIQLVQGILLSPFLNFITCFGEEWGWRGYLVPRLLKRLKVVPALLISGVIWGLWHAPLTIMGHNYGVGYPGFPYTGILAMCLYCTVIGIILSYTMIKTGSCIPAVIGHGLLNGYSGIAIYYSSLEHPFNIFLGPMSTGLIGGAGFLLLAAFLLWRLYKEEKEGTLMIP